LNNGQKLPLVFSGSCSVGEFYIPFRSSISENLLLKQNGGAVISIAATGLTGSDPNFSLNRRLFTNLFSNDTLSEAVTVGDALLAAKISGGTTYSTNDGQYLIMGDPLLKLALPSDTFDTIRLQPEAIQPLSWINAQGRLNSNSQGKLWFYVYDSDMEKSYTLPNDSEIRYIKKGKTIFRTERNYSDNQFNLAFFVPRDISYNTTGGRIIAYATGINTDFLSGLTGLEILPSTQPDFIDTTGPEISIWLDDPSFLSGDTVSSTPLFFAEISDSHGVKITSSLGHSILLLIDEDRYKYDLTDIFNYYENDSSAGFIEFRLPKIEAGEHKAYFRAWDNLDNSTSTDFIFNITSETVSGEIVSIVPYPNPFTDGVYITFRLLSNANVNLDIYASTGRKIWDYDAGNLSNGYNEIYWNGKTDNNRDVTNGIYIFKLHTKTDEREFKVYGKISREK